MRDVLTKLPTHPASQIEAAAASLAAGLIAELAVNAGWPDAYNSSSTEVCRYAVGRIDQLGSRSGASLQRSSAHQ